mmetsp:Transcript_84993/g.147457  ORF Transcript_84993/g.147457 Transcript_84993/m.147457 type:complete len:333 (-) Transcript_84993:222-1220(-)
MGAQEAIYGLKACGCICSSLQLICLLVGYLMWLQAGDLFELVPMKECFGKGEFDTKTDCEYFMPAAHAERIFGDYKDVDGNIKQHIFLVTNSSVVDSSFLQEDTMSTSQFQEIKDCADGDGKQFYGVDEYEAGMLTAAGCVTLLCGLAIQIASAATEGAGDEMKEAGGKVWKLLVDAMLYVLGNCINSSLAGFSCEPKAESSGILSSTLSALILWNSFGIVFLLMITACGVACCLRSDKEGPAFCCSGLGMLIVTVIGFGMMVVMSWPMEFEIVMPKIAIGTVAGDCTFGSKEGLPETLSIMMTIAFFLGVIQAFAKIPVFILECVGAKGSN